MRPSCVPSDTNAHYPHIFTDPDAFWLEQEELRDFITGLLDNHEKYISPAAQDLFNPVNNDL